MGGKKWTTEEIAARREKYKQEADDLKKRKDEFEKRIRARLSQMKIIRGGVVDKAGFLDDEAMPEEELFGILMVGHLMIQAGQRDFLKAFGSACYNIHGSADRPETFEGITAKALAEISKTVSVRIKDGVQEIPPPSPDVMALFEAPAQVVVRFAEAPLQRIRDELKGTYNLTFRDGAWNGIVPGGEPLTKLRMIVEANNGTLEEVTQ